MRVFSLLVTGSLLMSGLLVGCISDHLSPSPVGIQTLATGLLSPLGIDTDPQGRVWVAEAGTGKTNDGRISLYAGGTVTPAITGFDSRIFLGDVDGLSHLLFDNGTLYALHSNGKLYKANVGGFKAGNTPLVVGNIPSEDIGAYVIAQTNAGAVTGNPDKDSHPYQMAFGPDGDLFIADAAANCVVRRNKTTGALSIFANIPGTANPTPVGPPFIQSVPTGIVYDGTNLLVSCLVGFPFPAGTGRVIQVTPAGVVSLRQTGFNALTGLDLNNSLLVLEYGTFSPATGWTTNSGRLLRADSPTNTVLASGINKPTALKKITANSYFVVSFGDKSLLKVTF